MAVDVLVFGAHPDDAEIGCGGTLAALCSRGRRVVAVDLTRGEMGSTGAPEERLREAERAAAIIGLAGRENLGLPDYGLAPSREHLWPVIAALRRHRPRVVLAVRGGDPHPDHNACAELVRSAAFAASLHRLPVDGEPCPAPRLYFYSVGCPLAPDFSVDVSAWHETKRRALASHRSQFSRADGDRDTPLNAPRFLAGVVARDRYLGWLCGVEYAEGFAAAAGVLLAEPPGLGGDGG